MTYRIIIPVLILSLVLLLAACGSDPASTNASSEKAPAESSIPASEEGTTVPETKAEPAYPAFTIPEKLASDTLHVKKIDGLTDDFILGMDISSLLAEEAVRAYRESIVRLGLKIARRYFKGERPGTFRR